MERIQHAAFRSTFTVANLAHDSLPELDELHRVIEMGGDHVTPHSLCTVRAGARSFEVMAVTLGRDAPDVPAVAFIGGVHGLERIGAQVVLTYLASLVQRLKWDSLLHHELTRLRLVFVPLLNPGGLSLGTRANPSGVDLMRNAPIEAREDVPFLVGGQRFSSALPWYRGPLEAPMEAEGTALCQLITQELLPRPFSLVVDCHSGFGTEDRLWFPFAHTRAPIAHLAEVHALRRIFDQTQAHHPYVFEPQSHQYLTHGDLWDHLYLQSGALQPGHVFLPLTLEMGSWMWVKKNPRQLFSRHGIFNPLITHRQNRVLRRHLSMLDFMARATASYLRWMPLGDDRELHHRQALARWYPQQPRPRRRRKAPP